MTTIAARLTPEQLHQFEEQGYLILRGVLNTEEVDQLIQTFMEIKAAGSVPGFFEPASAEEANGDILKLYPRIMHPHRFNEIALRYLLDGRIQAILADLFAEEPLAAQSMFYFKPAGARGQALHQDNFYLRVEPGTCIAAWFALDPADRDNGGLEVVPGTHKMDIFCPEEADAALSFTRDFVPIPEGLQALPVDLAPGDVLFFNGSLVHGSQPNRTQDRFRRSFICHYIGRSSERMSQWYRPILTFAGDEVILDINEGGGPCGTEIAGPH
ncbi:phytanoyl-CoA dioxygenase family protein [Tengunoibacter tsumagoiensis]|uniref:Protein involved in biosynthesis of mitomycin antibiotics/polyketide fumonisin n=1 Tax=Tengunoibacter tsumagoiensis TaxID=2014871 RepID=A0A402A0R6_9CHLR|nr:phytanoyl-CoA dioxygenase family protein [Tengunoibacter tsumagoiensis]GCE12704.1 protein involved in biosynthesis of mitomycin antibiotics/polyketide fumonisin [Tengunoibacter tsumagoiensis]